MANTNGGPSDADVAQLCDFANVDREQALVLLKKWPGWQDAIVHYFEDPVASLQPDRLAWQPQENAPPLPPSSDMMSRPSSPTGNFVDMTEEHSKAIAQVNNMRGDSDQDLARAMVASVRDTQAQETGTTHTTGHFGPAQRSQYNDNEWAMTTVASTREFIDHPPPTERRRNPEEPAFLRGPTDVGHEAALLTIYHSIPLAREALMCPSLQIYSYGYNPDWWSGSTDEDTKSISVDQALDGDEDRRRFLAELQCLMAFLDDTNRAYGSIDALSEMRYVKFMHAEGPATRLLEAWKRAFMRESEDDPLSQVFSTTAHQTADLNSADPQEKILFAVDGPLCGATTQAELLDKILWADTTAHPINNVWLDHLGHILTMRVYSDEYAATKLTLKPTEHWYLDRYTLEFRETLLGMRKRCYQLLREKENLSRLQRRLTDLASDRSPNASGGIRRVLENAKEAILLTKSEDAKIPIDNAASPSAAIHKQIDSLLASVASRLGQINQQRSELDQAIKDIMCDISCPETSSQPLHLKYSLHGASTKQNVVYFRRPNRDLLGLNNDDDTSSDPWQWWRAAWGEGDDSTATGDVSSGNKYYSVRKVNFVDVADAVANECHSAILVYANETALSYRPDPMPISLKKFVTQDNCAFDDEISLDHIAQDTRKRSWSNETNSTVMNDSDADTDEMMSSAAGEMGSSSGSLPRERNKSGSQSEDSTVQNPSLDGSPPPYNEHESQAADNRGNKIGYYAEQLLKEVDRQGSKQG